MEQIQKTTNKMGYQPIKKLIWQMGLPMIISMVLQAVYNIVDTAFVINMGTNGTEGNLALTYAFPIQLLMIAIGVGTGVGINAMLSKALGEKQKEKADQIVGNGIFLGVIIFLFFLLFGFFGVKWFISMQAQSMEDLAAKETVIAMGTRYLQICCCFSFGSIGYSIFERFLQSTGKTLYSTISQIAGAATNIILDYVFIYPCHMGIDGAAWATIIGQVVSFITAMIFHYSANRELGNHIKNILPRWPIIKGIYQIGLSAAIMQGLLAVMMLGMTLILGTSAQSANVLQGSYGIYYKIMQFALFAIFGISNTIISILSFNYGMRDKKRSQACIKWGIIDAILVAAVITLFFEILAGPLAHLFGMASGESNEEITSIVVNAIRIASISYVFMAISVAIQGVFQALRYAFKPLFIALLRLAILVFPIAYLFTLSKQAVHVVWWTFPIVECITALISLWMLKGVYRKKIAALPDQENIPEK